MNQISQQKSTVVGSRQRSFHAVTFDRMVAFQGWRTYMGGNRNNSTYAADNVGPRFQKFCIATTSARTRYKVGLAVSDKAGTKSADENELVSSGPEASAIGVELHKLRGDDGVQELDFPPVKEPLLRGITDEPPAPVLIGSGDNVLIGPEEG